MDFGKKKPEKLVYFKEITAINYWRKKK